jgi:AraC family transcriptional regulator
MDAVPHFTGGETAMMSTALQTTHPEPVAAPPYLLELIGRAHRAADADPGLTRRCLEEISELLAGRALGALDRALLPSGLTAAATVAKGGLAAWQIRRVRDHVEARLDESILIEDLAGVARLSPGHFCRAFKASTGETPHSYIVRQRIRRAQRLMLSTDDTLSQIACACGLTDQAHLSRLFRRLVNDTPLSWRRTWRAA